MSLKFAFGPARDQLAEHLETVAKGLNLSFSEDDLMGMAALIASTSAELGNVGISEGIAAIEAALMLYSKEGVSMPTHQVVHDFLKNKFSATE